MIPETCSYCLKRPAGYACPDGSPICEHCSEPLTHSNLLDAAMDAHDATREAQKRMAWLSRQRDEAIRAALENGVTAVQLADKLGLTRQRIYAMARNAKEQK